MSAAMASLSTPATSLWPADYGQAWTLAAPVERCGVGLHGGGSARVRLEPSDQPGFRVGWLQARQQPLQLLHPGQVCETQLCTALQLDQGRLATVEHLLAAMAGVGLTAATLLVEGHEVPLLDGSALPWVEAIAEVGLQPLGARPAPITVPGPITVQQGLSFATALPADRLRLGAAIEFPQPAIGRQLYSLELTPETFVREIAPARTFGFREQVERLRAAGLIQGGALDNALVCDGEVWLNPPLRFSDEPVRHKLLDLLGDLALAGLPQAHVFAFRGSHGLHTALAAALASSPWIP
jgi:UDP-3-O-[3-hydroxymyristoyl] N-acetylglucosamine deacetylase